jgi:hypothetical protein
MSLVRIAEKPKLADDIRQEVIDILKKSLAEAEAGDISAVMVLKLHPDDTWSDERSGCIKFPDALGRLEIMKHTWITQYLEHWK